MSISKSKRLKAKRTPWSKTRSGLRAHARANVMRAMVCALGLANINAIIFNPRRMGKTLAVAYAVLKTHKAIATVPVYGSKTV